jgi:large exoprotein involved in heme utilization and adhesion
MLHNGSYSAWFKTPAGQGTGIVTLADGTISGGDSVIAYSGSYDQDGDRFIATVKTRRFCAGQPSVFGVDEIELKIEGRSTGVMVICSGTADQAPGITFQATLIRCGDQAPEHESNSPPIAPFDATKFPKVHSR